jgi:hypothetical protein
LTLRDYFLICFLFFVIRLVSGAASIAMPHLGDPSSPLDPTTSELLTNFGDHLMEDAKTSALVRGVQPDFISRVPAHTRHILGKAYAEIHCLQDQALTMAYLNGTSPMDYPDQFKKNRALLLYTSPELLEQEIDRASSEYAQAVGQELGLI